MYKKAILAAVIAAVSAGAMAVSDQNINAIATQADSIQSNPTKHINSIWLDEAVKARNPFTAEAQKIADNSIQAALNDMGQTSAQEKVEKDKKVMESYKYLIFASFSLDENSLKDIFISASGRSDTAVVFRGVPEGLRIDEGMYKVQAIAQQVDPAPNVILDPALFRAHGITLAPTLVIRNEKKEAVAMVRGLHRPNWIQEQVDNGKTGDLGFQGPAEIVTERDITEVMMERAQAIDWEEKKQNAVKRAWSHTYFAKLPPADKDRKRIIPASLQVTQDIKTPDGVIIAKQGDIINPLKLRPFTTAYVVFNPGKKNEIEFAKNIKSDILAEGKYKQVVFMFSELDVADDGWQSFKDITDLMDSHVYNLMPEIQQRFAIEKTPTVVTADSENFIVTEYHLGLSGVPAEASEQNND